VTSVTERVRDIVAPLLDARGVVLYDLEYAGGVLRVVVTTEATRPVDLDVIADVTRAVSRALDDADPISGRYALEVTSPGLERSLRAPHHFLGAIGEQVKVKLHEDTDGERRLEGTVTAADDDGFSVRVASGDEHRIRYSDVDRARTVFEWGPPPRPDRRTNKKNKKVSSAS
jgi:ribosome maturation factor RimP